MTDISDEFHVPWPTRPDGSNMTMGEMTPEQRKAQTRASCKRLKREFEHPVAQEKLAIFVAGGTVNH